MLFRSKLLFAENRGEHGEAVKVGPRAPALDLFLGVAADSVHGDQQPRGIASVGRGAEEAAKSTPWNWRSASSDSSKAAVSVSRTPSAISTRSMSTSALAAWPSRVAHARWTLDAFEEVAPPAIGKVQARVLSHGIDAGENEVPGARVPFAQDMCEPGVGDATRGETARRQVQACGPIYSRGNRGCDPCGVRRQQWLEAGAAVEVGGTRRLACAGAFDGRGWEHGIHGVQSGRLVCATVNVHPGCHRFPRSLVPWNSAETS